MSTPNSAPSFATVPPDARQITPFRALSESLLPRLNADLGISLSPLSFAILKGHFTGTEGREPTIGEVKLFHALDSLTASRPARQSVLSLETPSRPLAGTWADLMARRHALDPSDHSPIRLEELPLLCGRWLARTGLPPRTGVTVLTDVDGRAAGIAALSRLRPAARLSLDGVPDRLFCLPVSVSAPRPAAGDLLLYAPDARPDALAALMETPDLIVDARPLDGDPLPLCLVSLPAFSGALLYVERILPPDAAEGQAAADSPIDALCAIGTKPSGEGVDCLLRAPAAKVAELRARLEALHVRTFLIGETTANGRLTVTQSKYPLVSVRPSLITAACMPRGKDFRPPLQIPSDAPLLHPTPFTAAIAAGQTADTPGGPVFPVTALRAASRRIPGTNLRASHTAIRPGKPEEAYAAAENVLLAALAPLAARGLSPDGMTLSVTLSHADPLPDDLTLAAVCGLCRASAELCLPIPDFRLIPGAGENLLSVCVFAPDAEDDRRDALKQPGRALSLWIPAAPTRPEDELTDWDEVRALLRRLSSLPASAARPRPLPGDGRSAWRILRGLTNASAITVARDPALAPLIGAYLPFGFLVETDAEEACGIPVGVTEHNPAHPDGAPKRTATAFEADRNVVLPCTEDEKAAAQAVYDRLTAAGLRCRLAPVRLDTLPVADKTPAGDGYGVLFRPHAPVRTLNPSCAHALADAIRRSELTVLSGSAATVRLLLDDPVVLRALELEGVTEPCSLPTVKHPLLMIIGEGCIPAAAKGLLPRGLADPTAQPTAGKSVHLTQAVDLPGAPSLLRYCEGDLLAPAESDTPAPIPGQEPALAAALSRETRFRLTYTSGDVDISDGFLSCGGRVIGFLNGIPAVDE